MYFLNAPQDSSIADNAEETDATAIISPSQGEEPRSRSFMANLNIEKLLVAKRVDNIREGPSTEYEISRKTYSGQPLFFVRKSGSWYELESRGGGETEWVHESVVDVPGEATESIQRSKSYAKVASEALFSKESRFVVAESAPVRIFPSNTSPKTNTLYKNEQVTIMATHNGWSRISDYHDAAAEGKHGSIARWVRSEHLAKKPAKRVQSSVNTFKKDARIKDIPDVGEYGLTKRDVGILYAASEYYLSTGRAKQIDIGDKSVNRPAVYYLNFGGPTNHFFRAEDIPNLEEKLKKYR
jgi:SH3-like domain-containing protein